MPRVSPSPQPFTVVEYFPDPEVTGFHDPRQHAVSLAFVSPAPAPKSDPVTLVDDVSVKPPRGYFLVPSDDPNHPRRILTVHGAGYKLALQEE